MCPKSQIDGQNHKNTGVRRAIFHKRPSRRARPSIDGRLGNTEDNFIKVGFKEITFESCNSPRLSGFAPFDETQKAHLDDKS